MTRAELAETHDLSGQGEDERHPWRYIGKYCEGSVADKTARDAVDRLRGDWEFEVWCH